MKSASVPISPRKLAMGRRHLQQRHLRLGTCRQREFDNWMTWVNHKKYLSIGVTRNMPKGFLKQHEQEVGSKRARGRASHKKGRVVKECKQRYNSVSPCHANDRRTSESRKRLWHAITDEDFALATKKAPTSNAITTTNYPVAECLEECPVIQMSSKCVWHEAACHKCLRHLYVTDA